jgi:hypothetical protein
VPTGRRSWSAVLALVVPVALGACGEDEPSAEEAEQDLCDARTDLAASVDVLTTADPGDVSTNDIADAAAALGEQVEDLASAGEEVAGDRWADLTEALGDFRDVLRGLDVDTPAEEALADLQASAGQVRSAFDALDDELAC